jgi:hypothetical protein
MKNILFIPAICFFLNCSAQSGFETHVFFDHDKAVLRKEAKRTLDSLVRGLNNLDQYSVKVEGHTDSVGSESYNQKLSEKRIKSVGDYLSARGLKVEGMELNPRGETAPKYPNDLESGKQKNRRVDILVSALVSQNKIPQNTTAAVDTRSQEDLRKYSYEIKLINTPEEMMARNMSTMTNEGEMLASAGVACVSATKKSTGRNAGGILEEYYEIVIPVRPGYCNPANMLFWDQKEGSDGKIVWVQTNLPVKEEVRDGIKSYVVRTNSPGCKNFDCKVRKDSLIAGKFKMRKLAVKEFSVVYRDYVSVIYPKKEKKNRFTASLIYNQSPEVFMEVKDRSGSTYKLERKQLSELKFNKRKNMYVVSLKDFNQGGMSRK